MTSLCQCSKMFFNIKKSLTVTCNNFMVYAMFNILVNHFLFFTEEKALLENITFIFLFTYILLLQVFLHNSKAMPNPPLLSIFISIIND